MRHDDVTQPRPAIGGAHGGGDLSGCCGRPQLGVPATHPGEPVHEGPGGARCLDDHDDVQKVAANFNIPDEAMAAIEAG